MSDINNRKEVLEEIERLGVFQAIDAAENLVRKVRREAAATGKSGNGSKPVAGEATSLSDEVITALARGLVPFLKEQIRDATAPLIARIGELERKRGIAALAAQIAGIEQRMMKYEGVWSEGKTYTRGSFVTHAGSLWFCEDTNVDVRPGAGSSSWKLAVKKGHAER